MFFNYFLLAFRNLKKQRGYTVVNTFGLAIGLAAAMFILLYVYDELTFDQVHPQHETTYRMGYRIELPNGDSESYPAVPSGWDNYIKDNYSGIGDISSFTSAGMPTSIFNQTNDRIVLTEEIIWAEANIGKLIHVPIIKGNPNQPLKELNSIVLSESAAYELFGKDDPLNKTVSISHAFMTNNQKIEMMVTGVYADIPANSHIRPKYVANILALKPFIQNLETMLTTSMGDTENNFFTQSFFVCNDESKIPAIQADLQKRANDIIARFNLTFKFRPLVQKISNVHFDKEIDWAINHKSGDKKYVYVFITLAILILVVACINYINLSTARSAGRAREIGLRKTFGGIRPQLFTQFMIESFVLVVVAAVLSLLLILLFIPQFNDLTGKTFSYHYLINPRVLSILGLVVVFVTLLAGSYPALFISSFEPASVLKGKFAFGKGSNIFRQFLTALQFFVAVTLLAGTVIVVRQMNLMRNSKLNEAGKQIVSIRYGGFTGFANDTRYLAFKELTLQDPEIQYMTLANHLPRLDFFGPINMQMQFPDLSEEKHEWFQLNGDYDFPRTFGIKVIAGRDFDPKNVSDSTAILLNESAVKSLKLTPEEAVGKTVVRPDFVMGYAPPDSTKAPVTGQVIGVVEDFPYRSMLRKIDPLAIAPKPHTFDRIIHVRLPAGKMAEKIAALERNWKQVFPDFGFDYWFVDEEFARMYENETQVAELTEKFSALAILIACVGLYGLAAFMSEQRTKEIGIRKTMGASNAQILMLLLGVFGKLLIIACAIGIPLAYYFSYQWLQTFVYKTSLSVFVFGGAVIAITLITVVTVGYESLKASRTNPINALRHDG
jgi:putative ABC transport system permease protein